MAATPSTLPTTPRLAPKRLGIAAAIVGALLTGMVLMSLLQRQRAVEQPAAPPLPPIYEVQGAGDGFQQLHLKTSWAGEDRTPPKSPATPPAPAALPPTAPLFPPSTQTAALTPAPVGPPPLARTIETPPLAPPPVVQGPTAAAKPAPVKAAPATPPTPAAPKEDADWLFADVKGNPRKRQGQGGGPGPDGGPGGSGPGSRGRQSQLFPAAQWERPAKPERVIYASQILNCLLEQAIKTGQDGTIRCRLTETLYDKFGLLEELLPVHSLIMGKVEGASVKAGQETVPITVTKVELPDGTDLPLTGKMGSADGISGVPGKVDNRYPEVILTALLTAVTSIGTRSITGSTSGFQPNLGQEFTADAAQSLSRSGQKIVERSLSIDPVITVACPDASNSSIRS